MRRQPPILRGPVQQRRPPPAARADDELSLSLTAHDEHFLGRTLRCEGADLDRAMRLYHHSGLVRELIPGLLAGAADRERAAIPLREDGPSPHVIVTRGGAFVTCLAEGMGIRDLPVVPYGRLREAMDRVEAGVARSRLRQRQLAALPWTRLLRALSDGPGHVTRDMAEIVADDPETYQIVVAKRVFADIELLRRVWWARRAPRAVPRRLMIEVLRCLDRLHMCTYFMAHMHDPFVLGLLCPIMPFATGLEVSLAAAAARHPAGGEAVLRAIEEPTEDPSAQRKIAIFVFTHCLLYPGHAHALARRFQQVPLRHDGWEIVRMLTETLLAVPPERIVAALRPMATEASDVTEPASPVWLFAESELIQNSHFPMPLPRCFPRAEDADAVKAAWDLRLRRASDVTPDRPGAAPVRRAARVGRNERCPCGSGKKHKQCCLGAPPPPPPADGDAARRAADREAAVQAFLEEHGRSRTG